MEWSSSTYDGELMLITLLISVEFVQVVFLIVKLKLNKYKNKKDVWLDLIPFYMPFNWAYKKYQRIE